MRCSEPGHGCGCNPCVPWSGSLSLVVTFHEHLERSERRAPRRYGKQTIEGCTLFFAS